VFIYLLIITKHFIFKYLFSENSHADNYKNLITIIEKNDKHCKSTYKKLMLQMVLLSNTNAKLCKGLASMDAKLQAMLKADSRTRA